MSTINLHTFESLSHRDLFAASKRAEKNNLLGLAAYLKALAGAKYAIVKNDSLTGVYVELNRDDMKAFEVDAKSELNTDTYKLVLKLEG